jgi:hypothetical protein
MEEESDLPEMGIFTCVSAEKYFDIFFSIFPSPQWEVWTHHTFIVSYNMFRLIEPSSRLYLSASTPSLASETSNVLV